MKDTFTIAYVEDDPMLRRLLGIHLNRQGLEARLIAGSGKELLELLEEADSIPDACLLDLNMPDMDGFATARMLREKYPNIRILAYSGNDLPHRVEQALRCGAHGFISKDLAPEEIQKALIAVLNGQPCIRQHPTTIKSCGGRVAAYPSEHARDYRPMASAL